MRARAGAGPGLITATLVALALALSAPALAQHAGGAVHGGGHVASPGGAHPSVGRAAAGGRYYGGAGYRGGWGGYGWRHYGWGGGWWGGLYVGAFVPFLPWYYDTFWWHGMPYYYADDAYYVWDDRVGKYRVVDRPDGADAAPAASQRPLATELFAYPKSGQDAAQQATDRYQCHHWAVGQTGFDPTQGNGGVPAAQAAEKRSDYVRAETSCLEARGYAVR